MPIKGLTSKGLREYALTLALTFISSYLFNFFWESVHSVWLYGGHNFSADQYVRMICYVSGVDALLVLGIFLFISLIWRNAFWIEKMNKIHGLVILITGVVIAGIVEYRAVYVLKEWRYGPNMPIIFGIGLSPLVQISMTGLLALWLTGRLLYRKGPYFAEG
jgi:hypothetical protein